MSKRVNALTEKIMHEISNNEHFLDDLRADPDKALSNIGIERSQAEFLLNDLDWDAPDVAEQLQSRINKLLLI